MSCFTEESLSIIFLTMRVPSFQGSLRVLGPLLKNDRKIVSMVRAMMNIPIFFNLFPHQLQSGVAHEQIHVGWHL